MMPSCSHTGTPSIAFDGFRHFTSSTTSGSACLMMARTRASVSPRQSPSFLMRASISRAGDSPSFASVAALFFAVAFFMVVVTSSQSLAWQFTGLLHPVGKLGFVELALMDVEIAHVVVFGLAGRDRSQRDAAEERHFDVFREAVIAEEPALAFDAIEG